MLTAFLYGQSLFGSPSSLGPSSTPGVAGMSEDEFTPKRFSMLSTKAFCVISNVPNFQIRLKAQPVYQVNSPSLFVGKLVFNGARNSLHASSNPAITISSTWTAITSSTLPSTTMRKTQGSILLFWKTIRHAHVWLPCIFFRSRSSCHHGHCILRRPACICQCTPILRPLSQCRRHRVLDHTPTLSRLILQALALISGPAHYCRG